MRPTTLATAAADSTRMSLRAAAERTLDRHARAARKALRGGRDLAEHVERAGAGGRVRVDGADLERLEADLGSGGRAFSRLVVFDGALPRHERAAACEQRRGVLAQHRQR